MKYRVSVSEMPIKLPGGTIYGKGFMPEGKDGKLTSMILSHGYNSSYNAVIDLASALAEIGVFTYCYDFRGGSVFSKSSGSSLDMSIKSEINDLKQVIFYVSNLKNIDRNKIFLYGESQGGFVAALTADENIRGLYLLYPAFCIPDDWKDVTIHDRKNFMGMPLSGRFCEGLPDYDVFEHIRSYNGAVKIYHGDSDAIVPLSYSEKIVRCFKNAGLRVFEGEGHGFSPKARNELLEIICDDFLYIS